MRAIDLLKSAVDMAPNKKSVLLPDGSVFEFYMQPLTIAQRARAQKMVKSDDAIEMAVQLLVNVARDSGNNPLFVEADKVELRNALPASVVDELMLVMLDAKESEEVEPAPKTVSPRSSKKTTS